MIKYVVRVLIYVFLTLLAISKTFCKKRTKLSVWHLFLLLFHHFRSEIVDDFNDRFGRHYYTALYMLCHSASYGL